MLGASSIATAGTIHKERVPVGDPGPPAIAAGEELLFPRVSADQERPKKAIWCETTCFTQMRCLGSPTGEWDCLSTSLTRPTCKSNLYCDDCIGGCEPP
jgi:hypothetical protein